MRTRRRKGNNPRELRERKKEKERGNEQTASMKGIIRTRKVIALPITGERSSIS